jgi:hypothetical protein
MAAGSNVCRAAGSNEAFFSATRGITVGPALTHKKKLTINAAAKAGRGIISIVRWVRPGRSLQSGRVLLKNISLNYGFRRGEES